MNDTQTIFLLLVPIFLLNLPFGFWRAAVKKFSLRWFVAVHAPIPVAIGLRVSAGFGWRLSLLPLFVGAFLAGQFLGGLLRRYATTSSPGSVPPRAVPPRCGGM